MWCGLIGIAQPLCKECKVVHDLKQPPDLIHKNVCKSQSIYIRTRVCVGSVTRAIAHIPASLITPCRSASSALIYTFHPCSFISFFPLIAEHGADQLEVNEYLIEANDITFYKLNDFCLCLNCIELMRSILLMDISRFGVFILPSALSFAPHRNKTAPICTSIIL